MSAERRKKAIVLFSGGIDSSVVLWLAKRKKWEVHVLSFDGNRRPRQETKAFLKLCQLAKIKSKTNVTLSFLKEISKSKYPKVSVPEGYIPACTLVFYSIAVSMAEQIQADYVVGGHNLSDGLSFADAKKEFFSKLNSLVSESSNTKAPRLWLPLLPLRHEHVIKLGLKLKVPLQYTWTCYFNGKKPCGKCEACKTRALAFKRIGVKDPGRQD